MPAQPLRSPASDVPILLREMADTVAVLTLNRPAARNSLSDGLMAELPRQVQLGSTGRELLGL